MPSRMTLCRGAVDLHRTAASFPLETSGHSLPVLLRISIELLKRPHFQYRFLLKKRVRFDKNSQYNV